jgi:DHA1 family tetracycline resistance protein-like MFS transporter
MKDWRVAVMRDLIQDVGGGTLAQSAIWGGILSPSRSCNFCSGPSWAGCPDNFGRRPVLLVAIVFDYVLMAVAGAMWLLLLGA